MGMRCISLFSRLADTLYEGLALPPAETISGSGLVQEALYKLTYLTSTLSIVSAWLVFSLFVEPASANRLEGISGGVSGSGHIKRESLQVIFLVAGGVSLLSAVLAVVVPHRNALFLNYSNWKQSAIFLLIIAIALFVMAAII
jgi:hypothetical protein